MSWTRDKARVLDTDLMRDLRAICAAMVALLTVTTRALMQTRGTEAVWQGWMQCQVAIQGDGFRNRQTHTWTITGPPVMVGAIAEYPATWTVTGEGAQRGASPDQASSQWTTNGSTSSARIGIFDRASDKRLVALLRSSQQSLPGATSGTQQVAGESRRIALTVSEWRPLPVIEDAPTSTRLTGSTSVAVATRLDALQPANATGQTDCSWDFTQSPAVPAPVPSGTPSAPGGTLAGITRGSLPAAGAAVRPGSPASTAAGAAAAGGSAAGAAGSAAGAAGSAAGVKSSATQTPPANRLVRTGGPRTLTLSGFTAVGSFAVVGPRTLALAGFTAAGSFATVAPRTLSLTGFTGVGSFAVMGPRTIRLAGFTAAGSFVIVPPRTITLAAFTGGGAAAAPPVVQPTNGLAAVSKP